VDVEAWHPQTRHGAEGEKRLRSLFYVKTAILNVAFPPDPPIG
jgi:hypothetical protein